MFSKFKKGSKVIVNGPGEVNNKFYKNVPAIIIQKDTYYKDYEVEFKNGTRDWILPEYLRKPYSRKGK